MVYVLCVLLGLTVLVFVFSLTYVVIWMRRREFVTYRVFGASQGGVNSVILSENSVIAVIAAAGVSGLFAGLFGLVLRLIPMLDGIESPMPPWTVLATVIAAVLLVMLLSMGVIRVFRFGRPTDALREQ
jgi:ABC-type antimicrobial peptide transport system permease subunit